MNKFMNSKLKNLSGREQESKKINEIKKKKKNRKN